MIGDYAGVPISEAGRWRAETWSPDDYDLAEYACRPHAWDYSLEGPLSQMRVWSDVDPATQKVAAYHGHLNQQEQETTVWMDGRPHPPANVLHTWSGFTTGEWEGDVLVTTTTHLKETYIRRSGLMRSDRAIVRSRWRRMGDYLQITSILYDPVLMSEPYIRTTMTWVNDPTLVVAPFEPYFITEMNPHDDAKLRRFVPHTRLDAEIHDHNRRFMPHEVPTVYAEPLRDIVRAGGKVGMGSHGQLQGLGSHWEVWAMASGGLTPLEAIRTATITAAEAMGMEDDIGSIEAGKLADLMVLDRNPLVDLKNTNSIRYVMKAGTLWNGDTMDEVWPTKRTRPRGIWEEGK